ncbi:hypothetical protein NMG60_11030313 [Bertholletia excelsa]
MVRLGCTADGGLDTSKFSQPMPAIGVYIAAASAACAAAMAADAAHGIRYRKFWFPCKFFSLNATTLTLIAVAIKLSVDLNTSMPRRQDQLAKLTSGALICTVISNCMPSLGTMENKDMMMNIVALGILVITAIVNVCIQLGTGVIFVFWKEHAIIMLLMLVLLALMTSTALSISTTKSYFDLKYTKKHEVAVKECSANCGEYSHTGEKLKRDLTKYLMMAHTCAPQFVIGRSATCTASGAFCLLAAVTLAESMIRAYLMPGCFKFCAGESDYKWSTHLILVTHAVAVVIGTVAPAFRWFTAINFWCPKRANKASKGKFKVERYWVQSLIEWKECPLMMPFLGWRCKRFAHDTKNLFLDSCIWLQAGIVVVSKLVRLVSIIFMLRLLICFRCCKKLKSLFNCNSSVSCNRSVNESQRGLEVDLGRFVLHLEGEEELVDVIIENNCDATECWLSMGKKKQPKNLIKLLEKSNFLQECIKLSEFDTDQVPSLDTEEPANCWALPLVTLTSIAVSIPGIDQHLVKQLIRSVSEGLTYVRIVENNLNTEEEFTNIRKAAEISWLGIDLYRRWLDVDLKGIALQQNGPEKFLEGLADIAKNRFVEFRRKDIHRCLRDSPSKWPVKALAANSMYRISRTVLLNYKDGEYEGSEKLFERLSIMIADILWACLTNLPRVIPMECHRSTIEAREESVRDAIILLGKADKILEIIDKQSFSSSDPEQLAYIDNWCSLNKRNTSLKFLSSSPVSSTVVFSSSDICLSVE